MSRLSRTISYFTGLPEEQKALLNTIEKYSTREERKRIEHLLRGKEVTITLKTIPIGKKHFSYPYISGEKELNETILARVRTESYSTYAENVYEEIRAVLAPHILGREEIKEAVTLQLFTEERLHILLLGDPGTGKTDVLSAAQTLAEKSSMGLGSGTTGAGLSVAYAKGEMQKGLLLLAHQGLCCIDELNLMKKDDRAALYNAMEKGFITYAKGGRNEQYEADVRILATANPKGDRFEGDSIRELEKQLPFEKALISRFHFVFLVRKPDTQEFLNITKKILREEKKKHPDSRYAKEYIAHAKKIRVDFPAEREEQVMHIAKRIKEQEEKTLIEVSPRLIKGIIGFAKASARAQLRNRVEEEDVLRVQKLLEKSLDIRI